MSSLFGGDSGAADDANAKQQQRLDDQKKQLDAKEKAQAKQLAARRRSAAGGVSSKTLFNQVLGTDDSIGKKTKLGG